jgi:hypothetical protein
MLFPRHLHPIQNAEIEASFQRLDLPPRHGHQNVFTCILAICGRMLFTVDDQLSPNTRLRDPGYLRSVCNQRTQQAARNNTVQPRQYQSTIFLIKNYCANSARETVLPIAL